MRQDYELVSSAPSFTNKRSLKCWRTKSTSKSSRLTEVLQLYLNLFPKYRDLELRNEHFLWNFGPYSKLRTANWPIAWRKQTQRWVSYLMWLINVSLLQLPGRGRSCHPEYVIYVFLWHESEAQGFSAHWNKKVGKHFPLPSLLFWLHFHLLCWIFWIFLAWYA